MARRTDPRPSPVAAPAASSSRLAALVTDLATAQVVTITAAPGWGKTALLRALSERGEAAWLHAGPAHGDPVRLLRDLAAACEPPGPDGDAPLAASGDEPDLAAFTSRLAELPPRALVVDDAHHLLDTDGGAVLVKLLHELPGAHRLLLATRHPLPDVTAAAGRGDRGAAVDARDLRLELDEVHDLVADELATDRALAARLTTVTGGWPVLIRLLIEALRTVEPARRSAAVEPLLDRTGPVGRYLDSTVLPRIDACGTDLFTRLHLLAGSDRRTLTATAPTDTAGEVEETLAALLRDGLVQTRADDPSVVELSAAMRTVVSARLDLDDAATARTIDHVVAVLRERDEPGPALAVLTRIGRHRQAAEVLASRGRALIHAGELDVVLQAVEALPADTRSPVIHTVHAEALAFRGGRDAALAALSAAGIPDTGPLRADQATQLGLIHHTSGDLDAAIGAYRRGPLDDDDPASACLQSWLATAHWLRGQLDEARAAAAAAMATSHRHDDARARAYAHTVAALIAASDGDRQANLTHYEQALAAAERAGDELQQGRILTNLGSHHLEEARFDEALELTGRAIDLAERQGFAHIIGVARCNRSEALLSVGAVDEAIADAERAREVFARTGARTEAYAHHLIADARAERGELTMARRSYERALELAEPSGDRQGLVPAHLGLVWLLSANDPERATHELACAREADDGMHGPQIEVAAAWLALAHGDAEEARQLAEAAQRLAEDRGDAWADAAARTCRALTDPDPVAMLTDALARWESLGSPLWSARVRLAIARRRDTAVDRAEADHLAAEVAQLTCPPERGVWSHRLLTDVDPPRRTTIRALGTLHVERDGVPVPSSAWGSRKARELVGILVARSGRPIAREELGHHLWPDEPYARISGRLSTALSLARSALAGADGDRSAAPLEVEGSTIRLDAGAIDLDVSAFEELADHGLAAVREERTDHARRLLLLAEGRYGGDLLEDEPDLPVATDRRVELRSLYLQVARTIARLVRFDDPDLAIRMLLRVLDRDGYDEPAHLNLTISLLRAGRHGEARRRYQLYLDRMRELEMPAVPFHELMRELSDPQRSR